jgi:hypothetical protein
MEWRFNYTQKSLIDNYPKIVYKNVQTELPNLDDVLAEVPCMVCSKSLTEKPCDVNGCAKLSAWAAGGKP